MAAGRPQNERRGRRTAGRLARLPRSAGLEKTYAALFGVLDHLYNGGAGDPGGNQFRLPDYSGLAMVAAGPANTRTTIAGITTTARNISAVWGKERVPLTVSEMPSHRHGVSDSGHNHGGVTFNGAADRPYPGFGSFVNGAANNYYANPPYGAVSNWGGNNNGMHAHGIPTGTTGVSLVNEGGGQGHENTQPSVAVNVWIKT